MSETFGNFLVRCFHEEGMKHPGKWRSLAEMAKALGVKQSTFSTWCNDTKLPTDSRTIDQIAAILGLEVYDLLGVARRMPNERRLNLIATIWHKMPEDLQDEWYEVAKSYAEDSGSSRQKRASG